MMLIEYVHFSEPTVTKIHDTDRAYRNCLGILTLFGDAPSPEAYAQGELERMERDRKLGLILYYKKIEEETT